ncbi:MAG: hypothetical protein M1827_002399 [Pycnora praestabilis]|nr:MAG: hypothetical protein M1827_002399 [Pycnora praestabilis]
MGGGGAAARRDSIGVGSGGELRTASGPDIPKKQRPRKGVVTAATAPSTLNMKASPRAMVDALDPTILTPRVWMELFDIFQIHFSTDLPFLHPPTFQKPLRQSAVPHHIPSSPNSNPHAPTSRPFASPLLLLAFLSLTARFHPQLIAHHSPSISSRPTNPLSGAEYYASALKERLGESSGDALAQPSMERIQALLMLGLHEWGMCRGVKAWIYVGVAVRMAQVMGMEFEHDLDDEPLALSSVMSTEAHHLGIPLHRRSSSGKACNVWDAFVEQEIRRRTFWSCFVMDRYLSSGKYRPQMINVRDLRIQLPSSEKAFLFGERVQTRLLGEESEAGIARSEVQGQRMVNLLNVVSNGTTRQGSTGHHAAGQADNEHEGSKEDEYNHADVEKGRWEVGPEEGVLSRVVRIVEIWGRIAKWSCGGGRRTERYPPWDKNSTFAFLRRLLAQFNGALPRHLIFNTSNLSAHITSRTSTPYTLMHTVYFLSLTVLHREYVPFIPIRVSKPEGPLDPPLFPPEEYDVPPGWWDDSARQCFKAARDMMDLVQTCRDWGVLVETPMVGFAIYTVAFVGVYCVNFPQMDPEGFMCSRSSPLQSNSEGPIGDTGETNDDCGVEAARRALEIIGQMRTRLKMADGWFRTIRRMHQYFIKMKRDYRRNSKTLTSSTFESEGSPSAIRQLSLREGGIGGGLAEYKLLEKTLKEFGSLEDDDEDYAMPDVGEVGKSKAPLGADETSASDAGSATVKSEAMDGVEGGGDSVAQRDQWNAINRVINAEIEGQRLEATHSGNVPESTGLGGLLSVGTCPSYAPEGQYHQLNKQHQHQQQNSASPSVPPPLIPPNTHTASTPSLPSPFTRSEYQQQSQYQHAYAQSQQLALHAPTQQQQPAVQQQMPVQPPQPTPWNLQSKESWLNNLHTRLGGDDVAAFVDGSSWQEWSTFGTSAGGVGGWLSTVWGGGGNGPEAF